MMAMPSRLTLVWASGVRGPARATAKLTMASAVKTAGSLASRTRHDRGERSGMLNDEYRTADADRDATTKSKGAIKATISSRGSRNSQVMWVVGNR